MAFIRETTTTGIDDSVSGTLAVTGLLTATAGIKLGNDIIYASDEGPAITLNTASDAAIAGDLIVSGNDIKSGTIASSTTALTLSSADVTVVGDLTVTGDDIVIGGSDDATDKTILFRHDAAKTIIGLDDTHDRFIINADNSGAFDGTVENNDFSIDTSGSCYILGDLTVTGNDIKSNSATAITLSGANATIVGDLTVTGGDATISGAEGGNASLVLKGDEGDDAGDEWQVLVNQSNQHLIIGNDIASAGTYVSLLEITPHATATSSLVQIAGDLEVNGGRLTFGNDEFIHNESDGTLLAYAVITKLQSTKTIVTPYSGTNAVLEVDAASSYDPKILLSENSSVKWYIGNDADDDDIHIGTGSTVGASSKLGIDTSGNMTVAGGITSAGATIATITSVNNLADNGSIPITATCVNIDANGGARTGIRFGGTGTAGQIIIVNNTGGETLTFHATPGTCLVRGLTTSLDTMESLGVYMFVSDGALWNLIGGGSLPNEGLTAS